jgi:hypothetical protein
VKYEDVFSFIEYLDHIAQEGIAYIIDGKSTTLRLPTFLVEYGDGIHIYYNSVRKEGKVQVGSKIKKIKLERR